MGNLLSSGAAAGGKVVLPDGTVRTLDRPTPVAEIMLDHPHHFVVDVRLLSAGDSFKVTPLPADHMLEIDKAYAVLPMPRGKEGAKMGEWHAEGRAELLMRQYSSRRWRPSLGTIQEMSLEPKKVPHWLF